ncbi:MBL fold metallo-hydrolase [Brevibacillus sp. SYP-B805]|uniref:MBL fold metallo-hydrolase n=1 Tax=Brevibacillus sp. SYP-B805 TaxID=1578199 RepID=UPI0013EA8348|nr:MBL fold metallo-hydrolase [Brevibacillus sp. SYP-B805]NGQ94908.1 MBL fold metallo-hydrolase [Brevibacillus sp. SYP-B805]
MFSSRPRYANLDDVNPLKSVRELWRWRQERKAKQKALSFQVPRVAEPDTAFLRANRLHTTLTWVGHATFFLQLGGLNILTDPVWARRMGWERRLSEPGLPLAQLPAIDLVLISHGHYDHLHFATLRRLQGDPLYLVPAGLASLMHRKGFRRVRECSWWEEHRVNDVTFTFVPAQHWVRRTLWDTNASHWGGWVMQKDRGETIYFAGDSGYFRGFQAIGERFAIDYALMPIGAYEPEWFMSVQHVSPEEAVQAFLDAKAKTFIPMHYGAFRLADDTPKEALDRLTAEWERRGLPQERLCIPKLGEIVRSGG